MVHGTHVLVLSGPFKVQIMQHTSIFPFSLILMNEVLLSTDWLTVKWIFRISLWIDKLQILILRHLVISGRKFVIYGVTRPSITGGYWYTLLSFRAWLYPHSFHIHQKPSVLDFQDAQDELPVRWKWKHILLFPSHIPGYRPLSLHLLLLATGRKSGPRKEKEISSSCSRFHICRSLFRKR